MMSEKPTYEELEQRVLEFEKADYEYRKVEKELRQNKIMLESIINGVSILITHIDIEERYGFVNKAYADWYGVTREELLGKKVSEILSPDAYKMAVGNIRKALNGQRVFYTNKVITKDGAERYVNANYDPHCINNEVNGFFATIVDITEQKRSEEALRESEKRFRVNFQFAPVGMAVIDTEMKFLEVNRQICQTLGYAPDELRGRPFNDFTHPEDREGGQERWRQLLDGEVNFNQAEKRYIHKSGKIVWSIVTNSLIRDDEGRPRYFVSHLLDISAQKQAQEKSAQLEKQLQQAQKLESVGRLAGGVAHDFNNMLSVILGYTELALELSGADDQLHDALKEIQKAALRSANVTRQLLSFARKQTIAPKAIDLNETIEAMLKMLRRLIAENIDLAWLPKRNLWSIKIDPNQIDQILANLCVNAKDSIQDIGKITIETDNVSFDKDYCHEHDGFIPGDYIMIAVSDNGCGMDKEILDNLFEPFFTTKGVGEGTGLGLATVYGIVKQNKGFINVYSEPNKGTTFRIYFPRHAKKDLPKQKPESKETDAAGCETILLVEDEEAILEIMTMMLDGLGYTVLAASNPTKAVEIGRSHKNKIDLLITDVVMPGMNGRDLAKRIAELFPTLKCLFMSGYTANVIAHHGILDQGVRFIQKPFSRQEFAKKVREVLDDTTQKS
ncbi:MAG: PAS domain S-box protein [Pseudomonadota bacterium]